MTTLDQAFVKVFWNQEQGDSTNAKTFGNQEQGDPVNVKAALNQEQGDSASGRVRIVPLSQALDILVGRGLNKRAPSRRSDETMTMATAPKSSATVTATATATQPVAAPSVATPPAKQPKAKQPTTEITSEVEHFQWPAICTRLAKVAEKEVRKIADAVAELSASPGRLVAVGGCQRGEGATTLLLCTAANLIQRKLNVLVVDADLDEAQLSRSLGVVAERGWEEVLAGRLSLADVIVRSSTEQVAVLPLRDPTSYSLATLERLTEHLDAVRKTYDVVLLNLGPWDDSRTTGHLLSHGIGRRLDLLILVHNSRMTTVQHRDEVCAELAVAGVQQVAIAENFAKA